MATINDPQITIQNVNLKIDPVVKESAESVLANMGLSMSSYVGMCLRQLAQNREIPFIQKADPEFWAAEYRSYVTKRIIDSLDIASVARIYAKIPLSIALADSALKVTPIELSDADPEVKKIIVDAIESLGPVEFKGSIADGRMQIEIIRKMIEFVERIARGRNLDLTCIARCGEALKSLEDGIFDSCYEIANKDVARFQELLRLRYDLGAPDGFEKEITREDSVIYVDDLISYVMDAYEENPASIALRYTGHLGGGSVDAILSTVSKMRRILSETKFVFKCDGDDSNLYAPRNALGNFAAIMMANDSN